MRLYLLLTIITFIYLANLSFASQIANSIKQNPINEYDIFKEDSTNEYDIFKEDNNISSTEISDKIKIILESEYNKLSEIDSVLGYRIMIYNGENRALAEKTKKNFLEYNNKDNLNVYMNYKFPNYKVMVGDFRTMFDAKVYKYKLTKNYNNKIYIVSTFISLK